MAAKLVLSGAHNDASACDGDRGRSVVIDPETHPAGVDPGDLVLQSQPFAKVLQPDLWTSHCHHCFATTDTTKLSRCGRCRVAYYCKIPTTAVLFGAVSTHSLCLHHSL